MKILIVEDDELTATLMADFLHENDFETVITCNASDAVLKAREEHFDLILLDLNLPDYDGYEVLKSIRSHTATPVIVVSAYSETKKKVTAFRYGANDYITKPVDFEELEARIWLQLGKSSKIGAPKSEEIFEKKGDVIFFQGRALDLTTIEFDILSMLLERKNGVVSREQLLGVLSSVSSARALDNHIKNIRKKIGDEGSKAKYLKTQYGVGYLLAVKR